MKKLISIMLLTFCVSCSSASVQNSAPEIGKTEPNRIDSVLDKLNKRTQDLQSYQCKIEYKYVQPSVFDTQTLRKGILYYSKFDSGKSKLRVDFQTLQQDEDKEQEYKEQYIIVDGATLVTRGTSDERRFEGLWLIQMDYENKNCKYIQLTHAGEPNKPVDVFELVSKKLPIIGFTKARRLREEFDISLSSQDKSAGLIQVQLKVKPNSVYKDDYVQIDCLIDEKLNLPVEIKAISTQPEGESLENKDTYELKFINAKINEKIDKKVFDFQVPKDFGEPEVIPLEN